MFPQHFLAVLPQRRSSADGSTGYQVRQKKRRTLDFDTWIELPGEGFGVVVVGATAVVSNLGPDKTHVYQVRGTNANGEGAWSDESAEIAVRDERPAIPIVLMPTDMIGGRGLTLEWSRVAGAGEYQVETSVNGGTTTADTAAQAINFVILTPGATYSFKVRARKKQGMSCLYSPWSSTVDKEAPRPEQYGHQEDHTVAYKAGAIISAPGLPLGVPDPAMVIRDSIPRAVTVWNTATADPAIAGKNLEICEVSSCGTSNHDGGIIMVQTQAGPNPGQNESCGNSTACVENLSEHIADIDLIIEEPAWECRDPSSRTGPCPIALHVRIYWTDQSVLDRQPVPSLAGTYYYYIDPIMIHEFGHTFGLTDFYVDTTGLKGLAAVMEDPYKYQTPTLEDIEQLRAIYALHEPDRP